MLDRAEQVDLRVALQPRQRLQHLAVALLPVQRLDQRAPRARGEGRPLRAPGLGATGGGLGALVRPVRDQALGESAPRLRPPRLGAALRGQLQHGERRVGTPDAREGGGEVERRLGADGERLRRLVLREDDHGEESVVGRGQPLPDLDHRHPPRRAGPAADGEQGEDEDQEQGFTVRG